MRENPLIGCWKLVSCVAIREHGARVPIYGRRPLGRLYYDAAGNMSVHIMRRGRRISGRAPALVSGEDLADSDLGGYQAYFSTYSVDTEHQIVRHEVLGSLFPEWTGTTQVRYYELEGDDHLLLRSAPMGAAPGQQPIFELIWERIVEAVTVPATSDLGVAHS